MDYARAYSLLISRARARELAGNSPEGREYVERHHVLPRCLGGGDERTNIVVLTGREHFLAHVLLAKMHGEFLWYAVLTMKGNIKNCNSRLYENARKKYAEWMTGRPVNRSPETEAVRLAKQLKTMATPEFRAASSGRAKAREAKIAERRAQDPEYDARMREARSSATQNRKEGYQADVGRQMKKRMADDPIYAERIREGKRKAKEASTIATYARNVGRVRLVRELRREGRSYDYIKEKTGFHLSMISRILNGLSYVGIGSIGNA